MLWASHRLGVGIWGVVLSFTGPSCEQEQEEGRACYRWERYSDEEVASQPHVIGAQISSALSALMALATLLLSQRKQLSCSGPGGDGGWFQFQAGWGLLLSATTLCCSVVAPVLWEDSASPRTRINCRTQTIKRRISRTFLKIEQERYFGSQG